MTAVAALPTAIGDVRFAHINARRVFAVDGDGQPGGDEFQAALGALYPVAYGLHFVLKRRGVDARVGPLEGLWWTPEDLTDDSVQPAEGDPGPWTWTLVIGIPVEATDEEIAEAIAAARRKGGSPALGRLQVRTLQEGDCAEILHVGPYSAEAPTIARLHAAIADAGLVARGRHHEIYLGDPRRSAPARLRTMLRQPVAFRP